MWTLICLAAIFTADVDSVLRSKRAVKTESYQQLVFQENKAQIFERLLQEKVLEWIEDEKGSISTVLQIS